MNPQLAVAISWNDEARHRCVLHAGVVGADQDGIASTHEPKHFQGKRRHDRALRLHHNRYTPHDAVALGADGEQSASICSLFEDGHVA